jgi:16S rRNA (adenine1518-N6/adenine1519-N6)-dimethyltransferase
VANIPYYLTSNLVRVLSESSNAPAIAALLVQNEVAERLAAAPGNLSILGVTAQFYWDVSLGREVAAKLFTPPPKVDSQIVVLQKRSKPLFDDVEPKDFFRVVKAGFGQKRKTLLNSLSSGLHLDKAAIKVACESVGIDHIRRPQTLNLEEWHNLYNSLNA